MAVTTHVYEELAVRCIGTYGIAHQRISSIWQLKEASMFMILCSTDSALFDSSFAGTVEQLIASGVQELSTGQGSASNFFGGYIQQGKPIPILDLNGSVPPTNANYFLTTSGYLGTFGNGLKYRPFVTPSVPQPVSLSKNGYMPFWSIRSSFSAKSAIVAMELPDSTASTLYSRSHPLVMIDFGGSRTADQATLEFTVNWNSNGLMNWTR